MNKWSRFLGLILPVIALLATLGAADTGLAMTPQVAAGKDFTVTLRSDGTIWSSGSNDLGQLGDGTVLQSNIQVQAGLPGNGVNWIAVAAGVDHTVAVRADGTLWGWGANDFGQLGKGTIDPHLVPTPSPVQIGTDSDWTAVAAGASCTIALKADGTLWAWGLNNFGQLGNGDGTGATQTSPVAVLNPGASVYVAVSITNQHVLALQADGTLWSWGSNQFGQLGINAVDLNVHATPVQFVTGDIEFDTAWTAVSAGGWHSLAQRSDGTLWSWGRNNLGQLGNGANANNVTSPAQMGTDNSWAGFSAGEFTSLAFKRNGSLWSWGANNKGQLGLGGAVDLLRHNTPVQIVSPAGIGSITAVAAGSGHSLAFKSNGDLYAWGDNLRGALGTGASTNNVTTSSTEPLLVTQNAIMWVAVETGGQHTLARRANGTLWAWGDNSSGQGSLDPLSTTGITNPVQVGSASDWSILAGGLFHSVALQADGTLWSWGSNPSGQLGDGSTNDRFTPQQITLTSPASPANEWIALSAGDAHTLALQADGSLWAWGDNNAGQLGDGTTSSQSLPLRIVTGNPSNFDNNWVAVAAGGLYSVGLQADGTLWVWGDNSNGQFGIDPAVVPSSPVPFQVINFTPVAGNPGFNSSWSAVAAGFTHLLALQANGTVWGLGANSAGQLGNGSASPFEFNFAQVQNPGGVPFTAIAAGDSHSVALKADGSIWSWGNNTSGQLGIGSTDPDIFNPVVHAAPLRESSNANDWAAISAGGRHTVALKADGTLAAWGDNSFGQLGDGTTTAHDAPTPLLDGRISVPASVSFGTVALAGPYPTVSTTITNSGTGSLAVSGVAIGGANSSMFTIAPSSTCLLPAFTLASGGSCTVDVTFAPSTSGAKSASLTISSDDPVKPSAVVALSGAGFTPFTITASASGNGTISPSGTVSVPDSGSQLFTIVANPGNKIVDVVVDGTSVGPVGSYLFNTVTTNGHTISATFAPTIFLDSWNWRNPLPTGHTLRRVATNGAGVHVAIGDYGTILRSTNNGATWAMIDNGSHTLNGITYGAGTFIAVGSHGRVLTSADGQSWTARHVPTSIELQGAAYGNGVYVVVGNTQTDPTTLVPSAPIFTSTDGISWTPRLQTLPLNTTMDLHDVAFGSDGGVNNVFVATGQGGYLLKSSDNGATWLLNGAAPINPALELPLGIGLFDFYDIHFAAGTFVAVGASGQVFTSGLAASSWAQHDTLSFADLRSVTYNSATFLAVGATGEIWSSATGAAWTQQTSGLESTVVTINGVTPAGSGFLAVGDNGHVLTSTDGVTWAIAYPQTVSSAPLRDVIQANGIYTAVGHVDQSGKAAILSSLDGTTWTAAAASPASHNLQGVTFGNGLLVAVGDSGIDQTGDPASRPEILTSADNGASWTKRTIVSTPATSLNLYGVAFGGNQFVAVGDWDIDTLDAVILTSPDGITWTRRPNTSPDILRRITYVNGKFVAVGGAGTVLVSADGITWTDHSISFGPEFSGVAVKPGSPATLAAVGTNSTKIYRSTNDGTAWTTASHAPANLPTGVLRGITYADGYFVAVAESGFIFSSTDAITWTTRMGADIFPFGTRELFAATFGNGRFLAAGFDGAIMQSSADAIAAAQPVLSLSPSALLLPASAIGTPVNTLFTVTNRGGAVLSVSSITSSDPLFTVTANNCGSVAPAATCTFNVRFTPAAPAGTTTAATLTVVSTDPATPTATVALHGSSSDVVAPVTTASPAAGTFIAPVNVTLTANEAATITYTTDGTNPATSATAATYSGPVGIAATTTLRYFATDAAGNAEAVKSGVYTIHTGDLEATVQINGGASVTNAAAVTLTLAATDATGVDKMRFSNDGVTYSADETYATSKAWTLSSGDGVKTVYVRFTDGAGLLYDPVIDQITLDTAAPVTTASPAAGTFIAPVTVALTASESAVIKYTTDGSNPVNSGTALTYANPITIVATATLRYFATDAAGNAEAVKSGVYTIHTGDLVATVQINGGANVTNNSAVTLTLAATDATGVDKMRFSNDGVTYSADEPYATSKAWTLSSGDGVKTVFVRITDGAGLLYDPVIDQITLDTTAPVTTANPAAGTFIAAFTVALNSTEASVIKYTTDGSNPATSGTAAIYSGPITIAATTTLRYFATDAAGNAEAVKSGVYTIHTADLEATVQINGGASVTNSSAVTLTLAATDATGVDKMRFSNDGVTYSADEPYATSKAWTLSSGDGVKTVFVRFTDGAGLLYDPVIDQITLDTTAPVTTPSPAAGTFIAPVNVTLTASEAATITYTTDGSNPVTSATAATYGGPVGISSTTTLRYFATDAAGNVEAVKNGVYTIHTADLEATVQINGGASVTNTTAATLTLAATDATGVDKMRFSNDGVTYTADEPYATSKAWTLSSGDGVKTVFVRFTDGAGLLYDPVIAQITLDTVAPVTLASPAAGTFIAPVNVTLTASESAVIRYTIDGSDPVTSGSALTYGGSVNVVATTTLKYFATDAAGNAEAVRTGVYDIHTGDLEATVQINGGANVTNGTAATLTLAATDATGVDKMRFSNDGIAYTADEPYATSKAWTLSSGDGVKTVFVRFTDGAGLLYDPVIDQITLDTTAPVTTASPAAGTFIAPFNVTLGANEAATVKYTIDGSDPATSATAAIYGGPIAIAATTTLKYFATDAAGNSEAAKTGVYTIHTGDLEATVQINGGASLTKSTSVTLTLAATDATGVDKMRFSNDGISYTADEPYATSKAWTLSSGDGVKTVYVRITDGAGLLYDPVVAQITLDATVPATTASPAAGTFIAPVNVALTASESAVIKYTTDGSDPVTSGSAQVYNGVINVVATTTLKYVATDAAGNSEAVRTGVYDIHTADMSATVQINGGANVTGSSVVALTLAATDATGVAAMRFSNDGVTYTADEPYDTAKSWALSSGDGVKTVFVRLTDGAGLLYDPVVAQITLDTTAPVTTPNPAAGTFIAPFSVTLGANETATIKYTIDGSDPVSSGTVANYSGPVAIAASTTLKYFATDAAGNAEAVKTGVYTIHTGDLEATVRINGGANVTGSTAVTLTLAATDATGVDKMRFSNDGVTYTADEPYATSKAWTLASGDGIKTVYVRITDGAGLLYDPVIAQITLDTTAPVTTASPAAGIFIAPVNVVLTASEAATIRYTTDGSDPATSVTAQTYGGPLAIAASTTLKYFATDGAGNAEAVRSGVYDIHTADLSATVTINGGAKATVGTTVTLTLDATDATGVAKMRFSNDGITYTADEPYATSKSWTLLSGDGVKTVYVRFTDGAGLLYDPVVAQITLSSNGIRDGLLPGSGTYLQSAMRALQIAIGNIAPTPQDMAHGDVAPYYGGAAHPNGKIDLGDASVILLLGVGTITGL